MDSAPKPEAAPTSAPPQNEPSGPVGRLVHDHIDLDAEERRHRRDKQGGQPVMAIILGLTLLTAIIFYVLHVSAVKKEEARQRAAAAAAEAAAREAEKAAATPPATPPGPAAPTAAPPTIKAEAPAAAKPATEAKPTHDAKPVVESKPAPKADKAARPVKKADDKTKNLPRLPVLPEG